MAILLTLQDIERARFFYERGYWRSDTLYTLLRARAEKEPERFMLRDTTIRLTARAVLDAVDAVAEDLHRSGLRQGDRVSLWLPSRVETSIAMLACSRMGYACNTSLHRDYTCNDIVGLLQRAGTAAFFAQPGYGADAQTNDIFAMLDGLPRLKKVYRLAPLEQGGPDRIEDRLPQLSPGTGSALPYETSPDHIVYLAFTSGTTGVPKGVMHSNNTLLANARAIVKDWGFDQNLVSYTLSPMSHNIGIVALAVTLVAGGEYVVHTPLDAKRTLDRIVETGATYLLGVPTHAIDLLSEAKSRKMTSLGKVNAFQCGGAAVPPATAQSLRAYGVRLQNAFGMTENHSFQYTRPDDPPEIIAHTCGRSSEGFEIKIWREDNRDEEVPQGEVGELGCRGASLMLGYFDDQTGTENSFNCHGWFMTGDLARLDAQGNLQIVGRKKDVIIRGGHNIYPAKIEDFSMRHPAVAKAAAFPVADERLGERVCLAIVARPDAAVGADELLSHLDALGLSKHDMPEYYVALDALPLTPSGKILKRQLVELVARGAIKPESIRWRG